MGDEPNESVRGTKRLQVPGTVERMEPGVTEFGRIPDIVEPSRSDEKVSFVLRQSL
jgi:hypothetical protein